jgi:hypothetical protein
VDGEIRAHAPLLKAREAEPASEMTSRKLLRFIGIPPFGSVVHEIWTAEHERCIECRWLAVVDGLASSFGNLAA